MKEKTCIFNDKKLCTDCGECYICDLDSKKVCDNCGKCLDTGDDHRSIKIDKIINSNESCEELDIEEESTLDKVILDDYDNEDITLNENNDSWELLDDIDGLSEVLNDEKLFDNIACEEFPGLIKLKLKH